MTDDPRDISSPTELMERLKQSPAVLGILRYGSGASPQAADTDICVVVTERPAGLESVHFWIASGPVDMNFRTLDEFFCGSVAELPGLDDALREGELLYEREEGLLAEKAKPARHSPATQDARDHSFMRHGHAHVLHKLDFYKDRDPLLCRLLLCGATHWLLSAYVAARGLPYRGEKAALAAIRRRDPQLLREFDLLISQTSRLAEQIEVLRRLTDRVLEPVGGPWQPGEILFFAGSKGAPEGRDGWHRFFEDLIQAERRSGG